MRSLCRTDVVFSLNVCHMECLSLRTWGLREQKAHASHLHNHLGKKLDAMQATPGFPVTLQTDAQATQPTANSQAVVRGPPDSTIPSRKNVSQSKFLWQQSSSAVFFPDLSLYLAMYFSH